MEEVKNEKSILLEPVVVVVPPPVVEFKFDVNSVIYTLYLLYKANIITRNHIKHFLKIIKEPLPAEDLIKFLVSESVK